MQWRIFIFQVIFQSIWINAKLCFSSNEYKGVQLAEEVKSYQQEYIRMMSNFVRTGEIDGYRSVISPLV